MKVILNKKESIFQIVNTGILLLLSFAFIYPFWYVLILSLNEGMDASKGGIFWWPRMFTLENYQAVINDPSIVSSFIVSVLRTVIGTIGSIFITAMVAFGVSRKELPGRNALVTIFFIIMLFSGGLIPFYLQLKNLHLIDNFGVYVIPSLFNVWNMIVMKTSFQNNIPESLIESAKIEGSGYTRIFFQLVLPLSIPLIAALSLFTAVYHWNDWFSGAFYVSDYKLQPLQTYLQRVMSTTQATQLVEQSNKTSEALAFHPHTLTTGSVRMATIMVATVPILLVYPFLQRHFVQGVMIGSIKE